MFDCKKCGCCCRNLKDFIEVYNVAFPYGWKADGSCEMLDENNLCKVYENRPLTCNLKEFAKFLQIDEAEFYRLNKEGCKILKKQMQYD
jgi:Fe-S-cluster containining protein